MVKLIPSTIMLFTENRNDGFSDTTERSRSADLMRVHIQVLHRLKYGIVAVFHQ